MSDQPFATGHCLCGAVNFTINAEPVASGQCHCKDCQRASGTGHMSLAFFKAEDVELSGETASYAVDGGQRQHQHPPLLPQVRRARLWGEFRKARSDGDRRWRHR